MQRAALQGLALGTTSALGTTLQQQGSVKQKSGPAASRQKSGPAASSWNLVAVI